MRIAGLAAAAALIAAAPIAAQQPIETVTAKNPAEMSIVLLNAGYDVELSTDEYGDPMIISQLAGYPLGIYFYDCNEETNDNCNAIQLVTGFDRTNPWTAEEALKISTEIRFAAVRLDDEGDPFISWDIVLGDGIPTQVFLTSISEFEETIIEAADIVYADDADAENNNN